MLRSWLGLGRIDKVAQVSTEKLMLHGDGERPVDRRSYDLASTGANAFAPQFVQELADMTGGEIGEPHLTKIGNDVRSHDGITIPPGVEPVGLFDLIHPAGQVFGQGDALSVDAEYWSLTEFVELCLDICLRSSCNSFLNAPAFGIFSE